jgi:hypothetical protein
MMDHFAAAVPSIQQRAAILDVKAEVNSTVNAVVNPVADWRHPTKRGYKFLNAQTQGDSK